MAELTKEQRVRRRVARHNNLAARELPLFAGTPALEPFLTTPDEQLHILERKERAGNAYIERLNRLGDTFMARAAEYRSQLEALLPEDEFAAAEAYLQHMVAKWPAFRQPEYQADYWGNKLRDVRQIHEIIDC